MVDALPQTFEELGHAASALDADLSRSLNLLRHLHQDLRPETMAEYVRRTADLEGIARKIGLTLQSGQTFVPPSKQR